VICQLALDLDCPPKRTCYCLPLRGLLTIHVIVMVSAQGFEP
jgi:hypothetical protein